MLECDQVWVGSRHPESLSPPAGVEATTIERAAALGEAVLLAVPFADPAALDEGVRASLRGKLVLDANNPIARHDGAVAQQHPRRASAPARGVWRCAPAQTGASRLGE